MNELYFLGQVVLAAALGAVLGWQRERWGKSAGPRTYALVAAGSALFTILSIYGFGGMSESSRVASQIVIGIGFLGAGIIFQKENHIEGLTTAAGLWTTAAIGMAVGVRYFVLAAGTTFIIFLLLAIDDSRFRMKKNECVNNGDGNGKG